jgi:hypothetical protein
MHMRKGCFTGVLAGELPSIQKSELFMCHPLYSVCYSNFSLADIVDGSLIECRNHVYQQAVHMNGASDVVSGRPLLKRAPTQSQGEVQKFWSSLRAFLQPFITSEDAWSTYAVSLSLWSCKCSETGSCMKSALFADVFLRAVQHW